MKTIIIAAIAQNGVIGRTSKLCYNCGGRGEVEGETENAARQLRMYPCRVCGGSNSRNGTGRIPCNELPWPPGTYPEDMAHFRDVTMGHAVVMGRRTWESLPPKFRPLPGRMNLVVSSTMAPMQWRDEPVTRSLENAIERVRVQNVMASLAPEKDVYVIGGARLYAEALLLADELDLTLIGRRWEGDVLFPGGPYVLHSAQIGGMWAPFMARDGADFECVSIKPCPTNPDLTFTKWVRR